MRSCAFDSPYSQGIRVCQFAGQHSCAKEYPQHKEHCIRDGMQSKVICVLRKQKTALVLAVSEWLEKYE